MCGPTLCARSGAVHIRWEIPLLPPTYLLAGPSSHFFFFMIPQLIAPGYLHPARILYIISLILAGV